MRTHTACLCLLAFAWSALAQEPADPSEVEPIIQQLLDGHNEERAKEGLPPLKLASKLSQAAKAHALDMAEQNKMTHDGSDGSTPDKRIAKAGYHYIKSAENVAEGYRDVPQTIKAWMTSPPHRKNILADYTEVGLAVAYNERGKPYWCADFGIPMPKLDPDEAAKSVVEKINEERVATKLPKLAIDTRLAKAAREKAVELAKAKGGTASFEGIDQKPYSSIALSVASGHADAEAMAKVVFDTADVKAQVLGKFTKIGVGYATAEDGIPHWVLILATPARR